MKTLAIITAAALAFTARGAVPERLAVAAIIGEAGSEPVAAQRAIASIIRARGSLAGIYGAGNACVRTATRQTQSIALAAWLYSEHVDTSHGCRFFGCDADRRYFRRIGLHPAFRIGRITFWK